MSDPMLNKILTLCLETDRLSEQAYMQLARNSQGPLGAFWRSMAEEEKTHIALWKRLSAFAEQGMIPQVFDDPEKIVRELESVREKCQALCISSPTVADTSAAFLLAFRFEFYLLHPAFSTLLHYASLLDNTVDAESQYDTHIDEFIDALSTFTRLTPELELLGETLHRLWHENRALSIQSTMDELTRVLNRRGFLNLLKPLAHLAQRNNLTIAILMIDIDHFKKINDTFGHKKGDEVLMKVAQILKKNLRASDIIGRYGGEEFVVFLSTTSRETVRSLSENLRKKIEAESFGDVSVTISIGISIARLDHNVDQSLMQHIGKADACMYDAKNKGRNTVVVCES